MRRRFAGIAAGRIAGRTAGAIVLGLLQCDCLGFAAGQPRGCGEYPQASRLAPTAYRFARYARRSRPTASSSRSSTVWSGTLRLTDPPAVLLPSSSRPPGPAWSIRRPRSTRVLVVGRTAANVRLGVSSEVYVFRAWT